MPLTAKRGEGDFNPIPEGMHRGICIWIHDLGTHLNERFSTYQQKVLITWELPEIRMTIENEDKPRVISKRYTLSLGEKAHLRNDLESWRGKSFTEEELAGFDISRLLGVNCQLQVLHKKTEEKTYANIKTITPTKEKKEPETEKLLFSFEDGNDIPENTPGWIVDIIKKSEEWKDQVGRPLGDEPPSIGEDDIPF